MTVDVKTPTLSDAPARRGGDVEAGDQVLWNDSEVAGLLDGDGRVQLISRNEQEAPVREVMGKLAVELLNPGCRKRFQHAFAEALRGKSTLTLLSATADAGYVYWFKVHLMPSPAPEAPVLFHFRRLPREWTCLSPREREVVQALHDSGMNPKRAARNLGLSVHTLNAHRRSISQKCGMRGIGEFWVFVARCR